MSSERADLIRDYARKFPHAGNLTLAKTILRDHPGIYSTIEGARCSVRKIRGAAGAAGRRQIPNQVPRLEEGKKRIVGWCDYNIPGPCKALVLSDVHVPYHDKSSLEVALQSGIRERVDYVIMNGDLLDCHAISFWQTDPRERNFPEELTTCRMVLRMIKALLPKAKIIYKLGNHEERYEAYMTRKAPELIGVDVFQFDTMLELDEIGVDLVDDKRRIKLGDLNIIHGHEYRFQISNPVNPARGLFLKAKSFAMCGHFHQSSYHSEKTMEENVIATWSTGCLCDLHPHYMPYNNWVHGFAIVEVEKSGKFNVQHKVVRHGKIY